MPKTCTFIPVGISQGEGRKPEQRPQLSWRRAKPAPSSPPGQPCPQYREQGLTVSPGSHQTALSLARSSDLG